MPNSSKRSSRFLRASQLPYLRYAVPAILIAAATTLKICFIDLFGYRTPFLLYFGAVICTARYFGVRSAVFTTFLAVIASIICFLQPFDSIAEMLRVSIFTLECSLIIGFSRELNRAGKQMIKNERRFRAMIEKGSEGIMMADVDGRILYCSPSVKNITGYMPEELIALEPWELNHEDEIIAVKESFFKLTGHPGQTLMLTYRIKHKEGHWIWIENILTNLLHEQAVSALVINFNDITGRVMDDQQRRDFISIASHELKTPITTLKAYSQILQMRAIKSGDKSMKELIDKLDAQVSKIVGMSSNLLDVARINAGKLLMDKSRFQISELISQVTEALQQTSLKHKIIVEGEDIALTADKQGIAQVITNLLTNAIKYSPHASEVKVSSHIEGGMLTVSVRDYGIGISEDETAKVFDRLYRAKQISMSYSGLGLGLYISSQIIQQHGGSMGVTSKQNEGSEFWFTIPVI